MHLDPLELQESLAALLRRVDADPGLSGELSRARREFFGADEPAYVTDDVGREAAAVRFAEWFLLERESDLLGQLPVEHFARADGVSEMLSQTRVGVFIVEGGSADETRVRDLDGGESLTLSKAPSALNPGDLVLGRLYFAPDGTLVPSAAATIVRSSPQVAVAFQKDLKTLGLERRLTQAELEHLMFRRLGESAASVPPAVQAVPVERLEAKVEELLSRVAKDEEYPATRVSEALRESPTPGTVISPLLDEMAFDTDVDLDQLRRLLLELWDAHHRGEPSGSSEPASATASPAKPPPTEAPRPPVAARRRSTFQPSDDETLGQQLARRIEEGLAEGEPIADMFAEVEDLLGESVDDPEAGEDDRPIGVEDGDVALLIREFVWEESIGRGDEAVLFEFEAALRTVPVPRYHVESIETHDVLRFLLQRWIAAPPADRIDAVHGMFRILERFFAWLADAQQIDRTAAIEVCRDRLIAHSERLHAVGLALSRDDVAAAPEALQLLRVVDLDPESMCLEPVDGGTEVFVALPAGCANDIERGDLLFAALSQASDPATLGGIVVAVPGEVDSLLG